MKKILLVFLALSYIIIASTPCEALLWVGDPVATNSWEQTFMTEYQPKELQIAVSTGFEKEASISYDIDGTVPATSWRITYNTPVAHKYIDQTNVVDLFFHVTFIGNIGDPLHLDWKEIKSDGSSVQSGLDWDGNVWIGSSYNNLIPVPEASSMLLIGTCLGGLFAVKKKNLMK